jgi:hypothetical protein
METESNLKELTAEDFLSLSKIERHYCLSIFIPNAGGRNVSLLHSIPAIKDLLRQAGDQLAAQHVPAGAREECLVSLKAFFTRQLWHGREQTIVAFVADGNPHAFYVPLELPLRVVAGKHFFLKPLISQLSRTRRFYVLAISDNFARLFHCDGTECTEVHLTNFPTSLHEALSSRDYSGSLQAHVSKASGDRIVIYHGHSAPVEDVHENRRMYCRDVNTSIHKLLSESGEYLVLACVKELFSEYQQVNSYHGLLRTPIAGNPDRLAPEELHRAGQQIVDSRTHEQTLEALRACMDASSPRTSENAEEIFSATVAGRVMSLFVADDAEMWGSIERSGDSPRLVMGNEGPEREELLNLMAIETVKHGGTVYSLPLQSMPSAKPVAALFRY